MESSTETKHFQQNKGQNPVNPEVKAIDFSDLRLYLQQELLRRCRFNPSYSLRAMARSIGLNHSTLSQIIRGKRPLTVKAIAKICQGLGLSPQETEKFSLALSTSEQHSPTQSTGSQLGLDAFHVLGQWYHLAMLELVKLSSFQPDARWIARRLGVSINEINAAIERLARLDMIEILEDGSWKVLSDTLLAQGQEFEEVSKKKRMKQLFELALRFLENNESTANIMESMPLAISKDKFEELKTLVQDFQEKVKNISTQAAPDSLYVLTLGLFPLTA